MSYMPHNFANGDIIEAGPINEMDQQIQTNETNIGAKLNKSDVYNGLDYTDEGKALDARQGKALSQAVGGKIDSTEKGAANGIAELGSDGKVPSSQLPSYVDDVESYATLADFPATGENGKIYIAEDTNITYRWGGSNYVAVGSDLALGETSSTAYRGDRGKAAYDAAVANPDSAPTENSNNLVKSGGVYSAVAEKYTKPATGIPASDLANGVIPGVMSGATVQSDGSSGLVPAPSSGDQEKLLKGDGTWAKVVDLVYPVGSIYMSVANTSPSTLFGGTWQQLEDRFLLGASADGAQNPNHQAGETGGAESVSYTPAGTVDGHTLTTAEIPSHNHTFTGSAVNTGNQSQGHTHNYTDYYATTTGNCAISVAQMASHSHVVTREGRIGTGGSTSGFGMHDYTASWTQNGMSSVGSGNNHKHSGSNTSSTRTSEGISQNHTHSVTASGTIGNTGDGGSHDHGFTGTAANIATMPPYLAVYMWKRTA